MLPIVEPADELPAALSFAMACCKVHMLGFAAVDKSAVDSESLMGVVGAFELRPCQQSVSQLPRHRLPLSAEDCDETEGRLHEVEGAVDGLFDEAGYLIGLCEEHAEVILSEAIEGRVCTGALCAKINPESRVSAARPNVGRRFVGSRLYCDNCFRLREDSGVTPAKPVRVPKTLVSADVSVPPLTERGSTPGSGLGVSRRWSAGAVQARALRQSLKTGGEVFELNGVSVMSAEPKPAAEAVGEIVRGADDATTVVGGGGALDVGETARASARDDDDIRVKLDLLMDFVKAQAGVVKAQADDANQTKDVVGALCSRMGAVEIGAVAGSPTRASREPDVRRFQ